MNKITRIIVILVKNLLILIILLSLKKFNRVMKLVNLKLVIESGLLSTRICLANITLITLKKLSKEKLMIDSVLKLIVGGLQLKICIEKKS